jgi:hypothetical protein
MFGWTGKALIVDLASGNCRPQALPAAFYHDNFGGPALNRAALTGEIPGRADLDGGAVSFAAGPLAGFPVFGGGIWAAAAQDGTGGHAEAYGTSSFGAAFRYAGWDQLIIHGRADRPVRLEINGGQAGLRDGDPQEISRGGPADADAVFLTADGNLAAGSGLVWDDGVGAALSRSNVTAVAVRTGAGPAGVPAARADSLMSLLAAGMAAWREGKFLSGRSGCHVCHGACRELDLGGGDAATGIIRRFWLAAGICPALAMSGVSPWRPTDVTALVNAVAGSAYTTAELWAKAAKEHEQYARGGLAR